MSRCWVSDFTARSTFTNGDVLEGMETQALSAPSTAQDTIESFTSMNREQGIEGRSNATQGAGLECECGVTVRSEVYSFYNSAEQVQLEDYDTIQCESGCYRWFHIWLVLLLHNAPHLTISLLGAWDTTPQEINASLFASLVSTVALRPIAIGISSSSMICTRASWRSLGILQCSGIPLTACAMNERLIHIFQKEGHQSLRGSEARKSVCI